MSENTELAEAVEQLEEAVLELTEVTEVALDEADDGLLGKVLRPNGTRSYPGGGAVTVRNTGNLPGKFGIKRNNEPSWNMQAISAHSSKGFNAGVLPFAVKNFGTVDLDVTP